MKPWEEYQSKPWEEYSRPEVTKTDRATAVTTGANRGIAGILGLPVDTALNVWDLGKAALGTAQGTITGRAPSSIFDPADRSKYFGTGQQISSMMDKTPVTTTQMNRPDDKASQYLYAGGSALPGVAAARPETLAQLGTATFMNVAPAITGKAAADASRGTPYENTAPILASLATQAAPSAISYTAKALTPKPDQDTARAATLLEKEGVKLDAAQKTGSAKLAEVKSSLNDNPFTSGKQKKVYEQQTKDFTQAVLKRIGEKADAAKPEVLDRADRRIGGEISDISKRTPIKYDVKLHRDIADVLDEASRTTSDFGVLEKQVARLQNLAQSSKNGVLIPGDSVQSVRSELGTIAKDGGSLGRAAGKLQGVLDEAIQQNAKGKDYARLLDARKQYRALKQIEPAIDKVGDGIISPARLANSLPRGEAGKKQFFYERGDQSLVKLAQAGSKLIPDRAPNSGTSKRMMMQALPTVGAGAATALAMGNPAPAVAGAVGYYGIPTLAQKLINSNALLGQQQISDPRLFQYAMQQGLLANMGE